jgi:hypothetical protein
LDAHKHVFNACQKHPEFQNAATPGITAVLGDPHASAGILAMLNWRCCMNSRVFWYLLMIGSIVLYWLSILLGRHLFPDSYLLSRIFFIGLLAIHILEIPLISLKIGRGKNIPVPMIIMKTILYGFTWWVPLKKGIIER